MKRAGRIRIEQGRLLLLFTRKLVLFPKLSLIPQWNQCLVLPYPPSSFDGIRNIVFENAKQLYNKIVRMLKYILWDHDGVLVDTEYWYFRSTQRALAEMQVYFDRDEYLEFMPRGQTMWDLARQRGISEEVIAVHRSNRDRYYQEYLRTEDIEIPGVLGVLKKLSQSFSMAIVTTAKIVAWEIIHLDRTIVSYVEVVLANGDFAGSNPAPVP
jgi:hypothetical protein